MEEELGDKIARLRNAKGISQSELGRRTGVNQQSIGKVEKGKTKRPRNLPEIAAALGVTPHYLLGDDSLSQSPAAAGEWDHEAYLEAVELINELKARKGIKHIPTQEYLDALSDFYDQIIADRKSR